MWTNWSINLSPGASIYLIAIALVVSGNHDVIVYTVNSLYLVQHMPNAKLILYPDANHGSWYQNHEDFVFETNRFLAS